MRQFGPYVGVQLESKIRAAAAALFETVTDKKTLYGRDFAMEDRPDEAVVEEVDLHLPDGERYRLAQTLPTVRPPFEWQMEITADVGEADYIKHYLIRDNDIVLAQRKVLTPIDDAEAEVMLADLAQAQRYI